MVRSHSIYFVAALSIFLAPAACISVPVVAGEFLQLPPSLPGAPPPKPKTPAETQAAVIARLQQRFDMATGGRGVLTQREARESGWGWAADHFGEIDRQNRGIVNLDDVMNYIERTSQTRLPRPAEIGSAPQIIH
ncbi:hypothetical protein ACETRX_36170 [Labrys portucalensis]|uniref:EF-hand domain-containing protein n=1 Tax=Labrys neptuniae TaxID=376174 RepID=A0ABV6ZS79_9HYPH